MKLETRLTLAVAILLLAGSIMFGVYVYGEMRAYYMDAYAKYLPAQTEVNTPHASRGIDSESGKFVRVFYPNSPQKMALGDSFTIFWEYQGTNDFVVSLINDENPDAEPLRVIGVLYKGTEVSDQVRRGVYSWNVGELADGTYVEPGGGWRIQVADAVDGDRVFDISDHAFAIVAQ